jgi:hypothetical protein
MGFVTKNSPIINSINLGYKVIKLLPVNPVGTDDILNAIWDWSKMNWNKYQKIKRISIAIIQKKTETKELEW